MIMSVRNSLPTLALLMPVIVSVTTMNVNPTYAQTEEPEDSPFVVIFALAGVDSDTNFVVSWVTANNITRSNYYNATDLDLIDAGPNDGFVDAAVALPNGTLQVGDEYTACSLILKDTHLTCDKGFNAPTNRAEFVEVLLPSSDRK
jgi:hypothetical protein